MTRTEEDERRPNISAKPNVNTVAYRTSRADCGVSRVSPVYYGPLFVKQEVAEILRATEKAASCWIAPELDKGLRGGSSEIAFKFYFCLVYCYVAYLRVHYFS